MSTIVCAVDLTESARPVLTVAASLARCLHRGLELVHVVDLPSGLPPKYLAENVLGEICAGASTTLATWADELRATGLDVQTYVAFDLVDDGILARVRKSDADLLVVGTHARRGVARLFLGSVAEHIVRAASCPVVVVPPAPRGRLARAEPLAGGLKVVAGIDLSPASDTTLAWLRGIDGQARCDVRFVHLYWPPREHERLGLERPDPFQPDRTAIAVLTRELQAHVAAHFGRAGVPLRVRPFWSWENDPGAWVAEAEGADLLVLGTSQRRGSTALAAVRGSRLPVVCVPSAPVEAPLANLAPVLTVLATTDLSPLGDAAVREAYRLLLRGGGEVILFHVAEPDAQGLALDRERDIEGRMRALTPNGMDVHAVRTRTLVVADHAPGEAIVKAIRRLDPDLVVMSSHGRSGLERAMYGSVAEHVTRASRKPVLVVPAASATVVASPQDQI